MTQRELLQAIADSPAAMAVLDSSACAVQEAVLPEQNGDGTLKENGDPGTPMRTIGDLLRESLG